VQENNRKMKESNASDDIFGRVKSVYSRVVIYLCQVVFVYTRYKINSSVIEQCQLTVVHFPEVFVTKIVFGDDKFNV
jgi:hypothetical protein